MAASEEVFASQMDVTMRINTPTPLKLEHYPVVASNSVKEVVCCVDKSGNVSLIQPDQGTFSTALSMPRMQFSSVAFSSDADTLAVSSLAGHILILKLGYTGETGEILQLDIAERYRLHRGAILSLDWHCAGDCLAAGSLDGIVRTFALEKPQSVDVYNAHRGGVNCVRFLPNGHLLLSASSDKRIILWDVRSKRKEQQFEHHEAPVMGVAFSQDDSGFVSCDASGVVLQWDSRKVHHQAVQLSNEMAFGHGRNCLLYSTDENYLLTGNTDGTLGVIKISDAEFIQAGLLHRLETPSKLHLQAIPYSISSNSRLDVLFMSV
ncbi:hypothetical protein Aperf_G00000070836 [Anoplocephala perfoliata]